MLVSVPPHAAKERSISALYCNCTQDTPHHYHLKLNLCFSDLLFSLLSTPRRPKTQSQNIHTQDHPKLRKNKNIRKVTEQSGDAQKKKAHGDRTGNPPLGFRPSLPFPFRHAAVTDRCPDIKMPEHLILYIQYIRSTTPVSIYRKTARASNDDISYR